MQFSSTLALHTVQGVGKIGQYDIGRLCKHMDYLLSINDKLAASSSKRKKKQALRLDKAIFLDATKNQTPAKRSS